MLASQPSKHGAQAIGNLKALDVFRLDGSQLFSSPEKNGGDHLLGLKKNWMQYLLLQLRSATEPCTSVSCVALPFGNGGEWSKGIILPSSTFFFDEVFSRQMRSRWKTQFARVKFEEHETDAET